MASAQGHVGTHILYILVLSNACRAACLMPCCLMIVCFMLRIQCGTPYHMVPPFQGSLLFVLLLCSVDFHTMSKDGPGSEEGEQLVWASKTIFEAGSFARGSIYIPIVMMFPKAKWLVQKVASVFPDKMLLVIVKVSPTALRLMHISSVFDILPSPYDTTWGEGC